MKFLLDLIPKKSAVNSNKIDNAHCPSFLDFAGRAGRIAPKLPGYLSDAGPEWLVQRRRARFYPDIATKYQLATVTAIALEVKNTVAVFNFLIQMTSVLVDSFPLFLIVI